VPVDKSPYKFHSGKPYKAKPRNQTKRRRRLGCDLSMTKRYRRHLKN